MGSLAGEGKGTLLRQVHLVGSGDSRYARILSDMELKNATHENMIRTCVILTSIVYSSGTAIR